MHTRPLGRTGLDVSVIGLGGRQLALISVDEADAVLNRALDLGINLVETAAVYEDSEEKIGRAIGHRRGEYVVTTKTYQTTRDGAWKDIEKSLQAMRTDFVDLYQVSYVQDRTALARVLAPDGALAALVEAQAQGMIHHIGISSHRSSTLVAAMETGEFSVVQISFNLMERHAEAELLPIARERGVGVIVMKALACGVLHHPQACLRYVLSHPVATAVVGMDSLGQVEENAAVGAAPLALTDADRALVEGERARLGPHFCERQGFCQACPEGVRPIEALFYAVGLAQKQGVENLRPSIRKTVASLGLEKCTYCGRCEEMCPNRMPIRAAIREARALFGV